MTEIEQHLPVGQLGGCGFVGIGHFVGGENHLSPRPAFPAVIAVKNGGHRRPVVALGIVCQPDRNDQPAVLQLNSVTGAGGADIEVHLRKKIVNGGGDFPGRGEGTAIILADAHKGQLIVQLIEENHPTVPAGNQHGIVYRKGIMLGQQLLGPGFSAIGRAAESSSAGIPIVGRDAAFIGTENRPRCGADHRGNPAAGEAPLAGAG